MAEKEGFEPSIPFWGIHDFQSCALGQLRDFSISPGSLADFDIIHHGPQNVKHYFSFFRKKFFRWKQWQNLACSHTEMDMLQSPGIYAKYP